MVDTAINREYIFNATISVIHASVEYENELLKDS